MESYLSGNLERIKSWLIRMFDIGTEINNILGDFFVAFADVFSVFASQTAQDITGLIIQIFADIFGGIIELAWKLVRDVLDIILTPFTENAEKIKTAIAETLEPIKTIIKSIAATVRKIVDGFMQLYDEHIHPLFESIRDGLSEMTDKWLDAYQNHIAPVLDKLANKFKAVMEGPVGDAIDSVLRLIGKLVDAIRELWEGVVVPFYTWFYENMYPVLAPIIEALGTAFLDLVGTIAEVVGSLFDSLSGLIDFIVGVFTGDWEKAWEGVKEIFSGIWDGIIKIVEGAVKIIEDVLDGIEGAIDAVFGTEFSSNKKGKSSVYTNYSRHYSTSAYKTVAFRMPRLATGTVVPPRAGEFAAILGDNKRETEVVSPLSTMKQALKEALAEAGMTGGTRDIHIELVMDRQRFATAVYKANNEEEQRVGVRMVST